MRDTIDMAREAGGRAQQNKNCDVEYMMSSDALKAFEALVRADERTRVGPNNEVLMNALWKACGDDEEIVNATIESQGGLK